MSTVIACYKWVVDEADIRVKVDQTIDIARAGRKISDYDKNAIETAVVLADAIGANPVGLTFGDDTVQKSLKDALSRGLEKTLWIETTSDLSADSAVTARALAAGVRTVEDPQLVICAEGSSDSYSRQTAPRLGALLDWPVITSVCELSVDGNTVTAVRHLDNVLETVEAQLPVVVAVLPEINQPRIPGLKAVMAAGRKPSEKISVSDFGIDLNPSITTDSLSIYSQERKKQIIEGENPVEQVRGLVRSLTKEGVLS